MDNTSFFIFHFFVLSFSFFFFLAPVSKRFYVTNYTDISFFTCSVKEKQNNTVKFKFGVMGFFGCSSVAECSGVAECFGVAGCSGVFRCCGVFRYSDVPGFSTCHGWASISWTD